MPQKPRSSSLSTKRRVLLFVGYDGSDFCGWAAQRGRRTVHGTLTEAVRQVSGEEIEIVGASRTDSGAHARAAACHFDTINPMKVERWPRVLNNLLPLDLRVGVAREVAPEFHARFWALSRSYRYRILIGKTDALRARYAHYWGRPLDVEAMADASTKLVGEHDFRCFSQLLPPDSNAVRRVLSVKVQARRDEVWIDVEATAFCRGMMRRIAGALWCIGRGTRTTDYLDPLLECPDPKRIPWPPVLPARGLTLMQVKYGRHPGDQRDKRMTASQEDAICWNTDEQDKQDE